VSEVTPLAGPHLDAGAVDDLTAAVQPAVQQPTAAVQPAVQQPTASTPPPAIGRTGGPGTE
jgi:hypothetical protein